MTSNSSTINHRPKITVHPLSDEERTVEAAVLARNKQHFLSSKATPRETYDAMTALTPVADGISVEALESGVVRGCWVRPAGAPSHRAILFVHGGAYMLGSARGYSGFASQIAARTGVAVFALDYPLAPEHPFPAAYEAVAAGIHWLGTVGVESLSLVGDSAGGGLVLASLSTSFADSPAISSVVAFSPWTDLALGGESMDSAHTHDPVFQRGMLANAAGTYLGTADAKDPRASPLYGIPAKMPPVAIQVGEDELLLDDSKRYAAKAAAKGGYVTLDIFQGLHHVFQRAVVDLPSARRALHDAASFISSHW